MFDVKKPQGNAGETAYAIQVNPVNANNFYAGGGKQGNYNMNGNNTNEFDPHQYPEATIHYNDPNAPPV